MFLMENFGRTCAREDCISLKMEVVGLLFHFSPFIFSTQNQTKPSHRSNQVSTMMRVKRTAFELDGGSDSDCAAMVVVDVQAQDTHAPIPAQLPMFDVASRQMDHARNSAAAAAAAAASQWHPNAVNGEFEPSPITTTALLAAAPQNAHAPAPGQSPKRVALDVILQSTLPQSPAVRLFELYFSCVFDSS